MQGVEANLCIIDIDANAEVSYQHESQIGFLPVKYGLFNIFIIL
jgi:hypothetical protein